MAGDPIAHLAYKRMQVSLRNDTYTNWISDVQVTTTPFLILSVNIQLSYQARKFLLDCSRKTSMKLLSPEAFTVSDNSRPKSPYLAIPTLFGNRLSNSRGVFSIWGV